MTCPTTENRSDWLMVSGAAGDLVGGPALGLQPGPDGAGTCLCAGLSCLCLSPGPSSCRDWGCLLGMYLQVETRTSSRLHLKRAPGIRSWSLLVGILSIGLAAAYYSGDSLGWKLFYVTGCLFVAVQNLEDWEVRPARGRTESRTVQLLGFLAVGMEGGGRAMGGPAPPRPEALVPAWRSPFIRTWSLHSPGTILGQGISRRHFSLRSSL